MRRNATKNWPAFNREFTRKRAGLFVTVIERAKERGELPRSQDPRELVALIFGPLLYRRFFSREGLDEAFAKRVVEQALRKAT